MSSYLCYIPYWKITPISQQPWPTQSPPPTNRSSDYTEYMSTYLSRMERRLLDGLGQIACDEKIGRHSDQNHADIWPRMEDLEIIGDSWLDSKYGKRDPLPMLFLLSLSEFGGIRHRCSFRWYTDSQSAISRFQKICCGPRSSQMPSDSDPLSHYLIM